MTQRQAQILIVIAEHTEVFGYPPTVREISRAVNLRAPATVHHHLVQLREDGFVTWGETLNRTLRLTAEGRRIVDDATGGVPGGL